MKKIVLLICLLCGIDVSAQILGGYVTNSVLTNSYVPYSGATKSVNLNTKAFLAGNATFSNVVANNLPTYNVKNYGLVGDGSTDDRGALNTLLNTTAPTGAVIYFPPGTYNIGSNITVSNKQFFMIGDFATIHSTFNGYMFTINSTTYSPTASASGWVVKDLNFTGTSTGNSQDAFNFSQYAGHFNISNCSFSAFGASGVAAAITVASTQFTATLGGTIENCKFYSNYQAIYLDTRAEYINVTNCDIYANTFAIVLVSGNCIFNGNNINYNGTAFYGLSGTNNSHGIISNNNINHNTNYALRLESQTLGWSILNNHVYQGNIRFKNSAGINVSGGIMDCDNYEFDANVGCTFNNVTFDSSYANTTTLTSGALPIYNNCKKLNGSMAINPNTFVQSNRSVAMTGTSNVIGNTTLYSASTVTSTLPTSSGTLANKGDVYFTITLGAGTSNMADATPYFFGTILDRPLNTIRYNRTTLPYACTLIGYDFQVFTNSTPGSSESATLSVVVNNTSTVTLNSAVSYTNNNSPTATTGMFNLSGTGLSTNLSAGDYVFGQIMAPTWGTNPLSTTHYLTLYFKRND